MQKIQKPISDFLSDKPDHTIGMDATVLDAVKKMTRDKIECLLIIDNNKIHGIFTERDFLNRVAGAKLVPAETSIREVMTANPETLKIDNGVSYAVERMASRGFRNIPIIGDNNKTTVLTVWDVMSHMTEVLAEVEEEEDVGLEEWTDIGGG